MIRAIIFDCFGVLTTDAWGPFKRQHFGDDPAKFETATELMRQNNAGLIDRRTFVQEIAEMTGSEPADVQSQLGKNVANDELFDYVTHELKPHYKVALLSNAGSNRLDMLFSKEQVAVFDEVALSYETGVTKPEAEAYTRLAERLGLEPDECLFVDDQERHCTGAKEAGMQALQYKDFESFKQELEQLLAAANTEK